MGAPMLRRAGVLLAVALMPAAAFAAEWKIQSADGESSIKFGYLAQMRAETFEGAPGTGTAKDLYFRRARILFAGALAKNWSYFIETDSPNLGKGNADGTKNAGDVYIQDFAVTWTQSDAFKVDFGLLLIPFSHNSLQSAATLLPVDYGPYSFVQSTATDSRVGRDYGVLARGLVAKHFEYRVGVFGGDRGIDATNSFRYTARVAYHVFDADAGLFYTGTTLGKKKMLQIGAAVDHQEDYQAEAFDVFYDQPFEGGNSLTVQGSWMHFDGDVFFTSIPEQADLQAELGFYFAGAKLMPFAAWSSRDFDAPSGIDETISQIGLAWYPAGYNRVLKISYTKVDPDVGESRDQWIVQLQIFNF